MFLLVLFLLLAAVFGIGGLIEGVLWAVFLGVLLLVMGVVLGFRGREPRRSTG